MELSGRKFMFEIDIARACEYAGSCQKFAAKRCFPITLLCLWLIGAAPAVAADRVALVIGNSTYQHVPALINPENDATAVAELLREGGFSRVIYRTNVTRLELEDAVDEFSEVVESASTALFFYAGHGIQVDGENYIIPVDASIDGRRDIRKLTTIGEVLHEVGLARELGVVILDACRDNPFDEAITRSIGAGATSRGLSPPGKVGGNTLVAYATEAHGVASDGLEGEVNSPYTAALLNHLATPGEDIRKIFGRVRDDVMASTQSTQRPFVYGSLGGADYPLFPSAADPAPAPVTPKPEPKPVQQSSDSQAIELALWQSAADGNTAAEYQAYLTRFPDGIFAVSARDRLARLDRSAAVVSTKPDKPDKPKPLPPGKSRLTINATPAEATIKIMNISQTYVPGMVLDSGEKYDVEVSHPGHRKFRRFIRLKDTEHVLAVTLKPVKSATTAVAARATSQMRRSGGEIFVRSTGVASAESTASDQGELRLKAIGNAMEVAVMQVSGVLLSTESASTDKFSASAISDSRQTIEQLREDSLFNNTVVSRSQGHARLVSMQNEGMQDSIYTVDAEVAVSEEKLKSSLRDAGVLWEQVGRPTIRITTTGSGSYLLEYLRNAFAQNGIDVTTSANEETAFQLDVTRRAGSKKTQFGTFAAHCSLAYELKDQSVEVAVAADRFAAGPEPGFSPAEAESKCDKKITPKATRKMIKTLLQELNAIWQQGREYSIEMRRINGAHVTRVSGLVKKIFRVSSVSSVRYRGGDLSMRVTFKGQPLEFAELLSLTLSYENLDVSLNSIIESKIVFDVSS